MGMRTLSLWEGRTNMRRPPLLVAAVLAGGLALSAPRSVLANTLPAKIPLPACVEAADIIAVGKITTIEEKAVLAPPFRGATVKVEYRIAVLKIEEGLKGANGLTHV